MKALTALSKYLGCYEQWKTIVKQYNLKWTTGTESLQAMQRFFDSSLTLESMLSKVKEMMRVLPSRIRDVILFACLTGLRPSESCESVRLLNTVAYTQQYYNPDQQCLEHFRYPEIFLRQTKKAYISFITKEQLSGIASLGPCTPTLNAIRLTCKRRHIKMDMHLCRKVFASWLIKEGISADVVNLLQGRCSQSILVRHYLAPKASLKSDVLAALEKLHQCIR